ncbi:MAG: bifunctional diguanylate cyclase/phosphodiesterase [Pseudomonadota bacterium]
MTLRHADPVPSNDEEAPAMRKLLTIVDAPRPRRDTPTAEIATRPASIQRPVPAPDPALETVRALPEPVMLCDRSLRVLMANPGAIDMLALDAAPLTGADIGHVLAASPCFTPAAAKLLLRAMVAVLNGADSNEWTSRGAPLLACHLALLPGGVLLLRPRLAAAPPVTASGVDPLTGLEDRQGFLANLDTILRDRRRRPCAVAAFDFRSFRSLNDGLGHAVGDAVLREAAARLKEGLRAQDLVARIGADEFAVLQAGVDSAGAAERVARRLAARLSEPMQILGQSVVMVARAGLALAPEDSREAAPLLRCAGIALAEVKIEGSGALRRFDPAMEQRARDRHDIASGLRQALDNGQFVLHYQPLMDLATERVTGFEALIRWMHPERGMIPPMAFIPVAEERGLIAEIGEWVLRTACTEASGWPEPITVSVNVAAAQFANNRLVDQVREALETSGLPGWRLEIEITETVAVAQTTPVRAQINAIRALGVRIAVDDFGTGYSSLAQLRNLPCDRLKIDRSFVGELPGGLESLAIIRAVAELGSALGLQITAEGVETVEQRDGLKAMGCTAAQGYYYGRPESAASVLGVLARLRGTMEP